MTERVDRLGVGIVLAPDETWLSRLEPALADDVDYYAVTPETLWAPGNGGGLAPNGYHLRFARLREETGRPFVAHSVGMSLGGVDPSEAPRRALFLDRVRADHEVFGFRWWTDHLGLVSAAGSYAALPLPLPCTRAAARVVRDVLRSMREVVPAVGVENSALYFGWDDPLAEPAFIDACLEDEGSHLLLDLHNVCTSAENLGFEPEEWLARVDLARVIEIHVAGGAQSPPEWLRSGRSLRLDSHDDAVPERVFELLARVVPSCPNLRGVTLERMEGTVDAPDVPRVRGELGRIREILERARTSPKPARSPPLPSPSAVPDRGGLDLLRERERVLADVLGTDDPVGRRAILADDAQLSDDARAAVGRSTADGVELAWLLVVRLRFERLLAGSNRAGEQYERAPEAFAALFRRYVREVRPTAFFPLEEGALYDAWSATHAG